jgi:hypothetical protein
MTYSNHTIKTTPMTLKENIQILGDSLLREIADDYESFEKNGSIGYCLLRTIADKYAAKGRDRIAGEGSLPCFF